MAAAVFFELHGAAFRSICETAQCDYKGLGQAVRLAHKVGILSKDIASKFVKLDVVVPDCATRL